MARVSSALARWDPLGVVGVTIGAVAVQYTLFCHILPGWIRTKLTPSHRPVQLQDYFKGGEIASGPIALQQVLTFGFRLNPDLLKSLAQQVFCSFLLSQCIAKGRPAAFPAFLCLCSSMTAAYIAWSPGIRLLAMTSLISDSGDFASKRLESALQIAANRSKGQGIVLSVAATMTTLAAIRLSLPGNSAGLAAVLYLVLLIL